MSITEQIAYAKLDAICREMGQTLTRLSRSRLISQDRNFATALFDADYNLAVQHQGHPTHFFAVRDTVDKVMDYFSFDIAEGDILIAADPYFGGTFGNVLTLCAPAFFDNENTFTSVVRLTLNDLGGELPGRFQPEADDLWQETLRVTPLKLYRGGVLQKDIFKFLTLNSRAPRHLAADVEAAISVCRAAERDLSAFISRYGSDGARSACEASYKRSQKVVGDHLSERIPGVCEGAHRIAAPNGEIVSLSVELNCIDRRAIVDLSNCSKESLIGINTTRQTAMSGVAVSLLASILDEVAINDGVLDSFSFVFAEKSIVNPDFPAPVSLGDFGVLHGLAACVVHACDQEDELRVDGIGPAAYLFEPVGSVEENPPLYLDPGFAVSRSGWGPCGLAGMRNLASAEELEVDSALRVEMRELGTKEEMIVRVTNIGRPLEGAFVAFGAGEPDEATNPAIKIQGEHQVLISGAASAANVPTNAEIEFVYPRAGS